MASSPSSRRWKKEGRWATTTVMATTHAHNPSCLRWVIGPDYKLRLNAVAVTSNSGKLPSPLVVARPCCRHGRAGARRLAPAAAYRHRLPHLPCRGDGGPPSGLVAHLRPGAGRRRPKETRPQLL